MATTQTEVAQRVAKAEQRFATAIVALENYIERNGYARTEQLDQLELECQKSQRHLRANRTVYAALANQYGWSLP